MKKNICQIIFTGLLFLLIPFANAQMLFDAPIYKGKVKTTFTTTTKSDSSGSTNILTQGELLNEKGQYLELWSKNEDWGMDGKTIYIRDEAGNAIKSTYYSFGSATGKQAYKYDSNNNLIQSKDSYGRKFIYVYKGG